MTALLLLGPGTPMLFQGQEFASSTPFLYFADHRDELAQAVAKGRREFLMQFPSLTDVKFDQPAAEVTFEKCLIDWSEREEKAWAVRLHRDVIALRREDPILSRAAKLRIDGAVLTEEAFLVRLFGEGEDRLLVFNFGRRASFPSRCSLRRRMRRGVSSGRAMIPPMAAMVSVSRSIRTAGSFRAAPPSCSRAPTRRGLDFGPIREPVRRRSCARLCVPVRSCACVPQKR